MAGEVQVRFTGRVENGDLLETLPTITTKYDQAASGVDGGVRSIGTSDEVVSFTDITTEGFLFIRNLDATNFVQYGPESAAAMVVFGKIKAGEWAWLRLDPTTILRMQADTAAVKIQLKLFED